MDGFRSNLLNITPGVLQGSILELILFMIYVNNMHSIRDRFNSIAYADDNHFYQPTINIYSWC